MPFLTLALAASALASALSPSPAGDEVDFEREVREVLETRCTRCHGERKRKADLRLDSAAGLAAGGESGAPLIVPGDPAASLLWQRVTHDDVLERMPPSGDPLTAEQLDGLRRWIEAGAAWPEDDGARAHWAYVPPVDPAVPEVAGVDHPVDAFVVAARGGEPVAPQAEPAALLRRVSLDLTGLPPDPATVRAFEADPSDAAYARLVDELLASPHYGEHQAREWLDLARYADSQGYEKDDRRTMWRWRDWVIDAFNADMPFDRFTVEQLAGDLLPDATIDQQIATGFHRNTMTNREGGVDAEEFRVAAVVDRVDTTATVWMGSTLGCARCHDHEYDPFSQREYYELYAFFDHTEDDGTSDEPRLPAPTPAIEAAVAAADARAAELDALLGTQTPALDAELAAWLAAWGDGFAWRTLRPDRTTAAEGTRLAVLDDDSVLAVGDVLSTDTYTLGLPLAAGGGEASGAAAAEPVVGLRLEVLTDETFPGVGGPGRTGHGNFVLNELSLARVGADGVETPVALAGARADHSQGGNPAWPAGHAVDGDPSSGWAVGGGEGAGHQLVVELAEPLVPSPGERLLLRLEQGFGGGHLIGRLRVAVTARPVDALVDVPPPAVEAVLETPADARDGEQLARLEAWHRGVAPSLAVARAARSALQRPEVPTALVLREREEPRDTRLLARGSHLSPGDPVSADVPAVLPPLGARSDGARPTRLDLARWLVTPGHPLTARVAVNRHWARLFGTGLVATVDDFGTQGERPSHPLLLDWLARRYEEGWSTRALLRTIVTSRTYRQTAAAPADAWREDPANRRLRRGPRVRVEAETVRDVALAASGLLARTVGGPSVFPPQPEGTWAMTYSADRWETSEGDDRFRRGLYTFWRRTAPYPTYQLFDAPSRELVCARRDRTNTPLQALAVLNDPVFVECARALAARLLALPDATDAARVEEGYRLCVARAPTAAETAVLLELLADRRAAGREDPEAAATFAHGEPAADLDAGELAAWTLVANVLLNLDETLTK